MFPEFVYFQLLGSILGTYLFANLFSWLIKLVFRSINYHKRLVLGGLITIVFGGLLNAFGAGEGGFEARLAMVEGFGLWFIWQQFYGTMAMLGIYFTIFALARKE